MKKKTVKKLVLAKETLKNLELLDVRGGDYIWTFGENSCKYCDWQPIE